MSNFLKKSYGSNFEIDSAKLLRFKNNIDNNVCHRIFSCIHKTKLLKCLACDILHVYWK